MSKKSGCKRKRIPTNLVEINPWLTEPPLQLPIAPSGLYQEQPRNQSPHEFPDPWLQNCWNQQPYPSPWLPTHWVQQTDYYGNPCWLYSKTYRDRMDLGSHFNFHEVPYQFQSTMPSYYIRNDNLAFHSQTKPPAHKHRTKGSCNLKTVSVNTVVTLFSSKDTASIGECDATPSSKASTVDLDATLHFDSTGELDSITPSNNKASTVDFGSTLHSKYTAKTVDLDASLHSSKDRASIGELDSTPPSNNKASTVDLDPWLSKYTAKTVDLDATLHSSKDTAIVGELYATPPPPKASTVDLDAALYSSNDLASVGELDYTLPSNNKASTVDFDSNLHSKYTAKTVDLDASLHSSKDRASIGELDSTPPSNNKASTVDLDPWLSKYTAKTVDLDATLHSSNDLTSIGELDSTLPSNNKASTVDLHSTLHSNYTARTVDCDAILHSSNVAGTFNSGSKRVSKQRSPSRTVEMNRDGSIMVQIKKFEVGEDVQYLYSVEPNEEKLVKLVDLSEDIQVSQNQDLLHPVSKNSYITDNSYFETSDLASLKGFTGDDPCSTLINNLKSYAQNTHEKHCGDACCICNKSLIELHNNKCDLYHARCGHLYCVLCIKYLNFQSQCIKCNEAISSLRKIVL